MNKKEKSLFSIKSHLWHHIHQSLKDRWILATIMFVLTIGMTLLLITNIKVIEYITALLVSKSIIDSSNNIDKLRELLTNNGFTNEQINAVLAGFLGKDQEKLTQEIINEFFYSNVSYKDGILFINIWGLDLDLYGFVYVMITDISLIVLIAYMVYIVSGYIARSYETKIKKALIDKLIDQDLHYFNQNKTGDLINALVKESSELAKQIKEAPVTYLLSGVTIIISSILMFNIDWKLAACVFGLLVICLTLVFIFIAITNATTKKIHKLNKKLDNEMNEKVYSMRLIKSSGTFNQEKAEFSDIITKVGQKNKKKLYLSEISNALIIGGIGSFSMASVIFGVILYYNNTQSLVSIMTAFTAGVIVMTLPILQLRQVLADEPQARIAATNVTKILNSEMNVKKDLTNKLTQNVEQINFANVSFAYPDSDDVVLKDINLTLKKNHKYAFVGPTGSGKSTIAKLVLRFYDPTSGKIIINNNQELSQLNLKSWLDKIGYVDQEPQILSGTIYANIAYGLENVTKEAVIEAAKKAKLHELIMSWTDGYDTILFERGSQLSGGQKQRLVIARLILKNPEILILDEATSALDNIVEAEIQTELEKLMVGRTTISIAHRLSTIKTFDQIFVIEPGVGIVQSGTFDQLINKPGLFKNLYDISN